MNMEAVTTLDQSCETHSRFNLPEFDTKFLVFDKGNGQSKVIWRAPAEISKDMLRHHFHLKYQKMKDNKKI